MRIAVIADTHMPRGRRRLPQRCLAELAGADLILHAGDVVTRGVLEELGRLAPIEAVAGNMDEAALQEALPETRVVVAGGARIAVVHDAGPRAGRAKRLRERFPGCQAVVYGHTHVPEIAREDAVWVLNPGSPTERRRAPSRAMLVLTARAGGLAPELVPFGP